MPIDKEKSSSYLRYLKNLNEVTYAKITDLSGIPNATMSAYFNGTVKNPSRDTFEKIMNAVGGTWDEYDNWVPDVVADMPPPPKGDASIEQAYKAFESSAMRMEAAFNASLARMEAAHDKEITRMEKDHAATVWALRIEKYIMVGIVVVLGFYAISQFSH